MDNLHNFMDSWGMAYVASSQQVRAAAERVMARPLSGDEEFYEQERQVFLELENMLDRHAPPQIKVVRRADAPEPPHLQEFDDV